MFTAKTCTSCALVHPEQIAKQTGGAMKPDDPGWPTSKHGRTIYAAILRVAAWAGLNGGDESHALRQAKPARGRRLHDPGRKLHVPESLRIIHRPRKSRRRLVPGQGRLI